jgi:multiple sugar transport system substrate-binding protein
MVGGPTGFEGAERYQYPADSPAGRAIAGLNALPADQKPDTLTLMVISGAEGHLEVAFPQGAQSVKELFKEETGIDLEIIVVSSDEMFTKIIQDTTTQSAGYDIYNYWGNTGNTLAESGALLILNDYVAKYAPDWDQYYTGGAATVQQFNTHRGNYVGISFDGDYHTWFYRTDLFEDPEEQAAFKEKYGWDLQWPETWEQLDQVSEFFNRPDEGLYGVTDLRNPGWGWTNWYQRYASSADPAMKLFDPDTAKPLIDDPKAWLLPKLMPIP